MSGHDFRALCAELVQQIEDDRSIVTAHDHPLIIRVRAALPEGK
jgi:hypothetical protein